MHTSAVSANLAVLRDSENVEGSSRAKVNLDESSSDELRAGRDYTFDELHVAGNEH